MASSADFFNSGLFFNEQNNPFALSRLEEATLLEDLQREREQPFTQQQAQQAVAPNMASPVMGMPGPPGLPPGAPMGMPGPRPQMPPQAQPAPQGGGLDAFLGSPGFAMASAALSNLGNSAPNSRGAQVDPVQAYQQAVQRRALLKQQEQMAALREAQEKRLQGAEKRAAEKFQISKNPAYEYEQLVGKGLIDPEVTSFTDFSRMGLSSQLSSVQKNFGDWQKLNPPKPGETPEAYRARSAAAFDNLARRPILYGTGAGSQAVTSGVTPGQGGGALTTVGQMVDAETELAGSTAAATEWAAADQAWDTAFTESAPVLDDTLGVIDGLLAELRANPNMDTGMLEGYWTANVDPLVARLDTLSTQLTVPALAAAKLNPVTEQEFESIKSTFASPKKDVPANIASLEATREWLTIRAQQMADMQEYFNKNGTLKGFSGGYRFKNIPSTTGADKGPGAVKVYNQATGEFE